ncbi:chorion peroxidase-like [Amblyomma americanum]
MSGATGGTLQTRAATALCGASVRGIGTLDSTSPSVHKQPIRLPHSGVVPPSDMPPLVHGTPAATSGGCPFAATQGVHLSRKDKEKAELALRFEEFSRVVVSSSRLPNASQELVASAEKAASRLARSSELCRRPGLKRCDGVGPYRNADGTCNNLEHPEWGAAGACMRRLLPPAYEDGVSAPRLSKRSARPLPSARRLSYAAHPDKAAYDTRWSEMLAHFGQFVAHDISGLFVLDPAGPEFAHNLGRDTYNCCSREELLSDSQCFPIDVPADDPFYSQYKFRCMNFRRSAPCLTCKLGYRNQTNFVTSYIDASLVYGVSEEQTRSIRLLEKGLLKEQLVNGSRLLPASSRPDIDQCSKKAKGRLCFEAGDRRLNQNLGLLLMHTLWFREHNRIARKLAQVNPHWSDERLFQVSRRIVEARLQHVVYNEQLPQVVGAEAMVLNGLQPLRVGYTKYDATIDATVVNEFTSAAFRLGHSLIDADNETLVLSSGEKLSFPLRYHWFQPFPFHKTDVIDAITTHRLGKPSQKVDRYFTHDLTRHAFRLAGGPRPFGLDLFAFDIQRGRDNGMRSYADYVSHCIPGIRLEAFQDLEQLIPRDAVQIFASLYEDVRDVDLFSAGLAERKLPLSMVGPTFSCMIGPMFRRLKFGDRFFYEHGGQAGSFTPGKYPLPLTKTLH